MLEPANDHYELYSIIEKLTELGWKDEIAAIPPHAHLGTLKTVRQTTRLTDRSMEFALDFFLN